MRVYVTTQVVQRELDSRLLLSAHLTALGHTVSFGPRPALLAHRRLHGPGVYVLSNASQKSFIDRGETEGLTFAILDEEALLIDDEDRFVRMRLDAGTLTLSERYFCWGQHHHDVVASSITSEASPLRVTGNPRFELLEPRFH